jgi:rhomboid protease GluP
VGGTSSAARSGRRAVFGLIAVNTAVELVLLGADLGLWGSPVWRPLAYQFGGFWSGLLRDWQPNFAAQPLTMFATYSFLHSGPEHLIGNMASLAILGRGVATRMGARDFLLAYGVTALAGALVFGMVSATAAPMVGASGAIFGMAGILAVWDGDRQRRLGRRGRGVWIVLALVALNAVLWGVSGGLLAWQSHLGGFLAGAGLGRFARRK